MWKKYSRSKVRFFFAIFNEMVSCIKTLLWTKIVEHKIIYKNEIYNISKFSDCCKFM